MMYRPLYILVLLCFFTHVNGQFGNDWVQYGSDHLKFMIGADGFYRISAEYLQQQGFGEASRDQLRMYRLGKEVPLHISGQQAQLVPGDYIEFYAYKNRGELDRVFYEDPDADQLNSEYSMFSDSIAYFLTIVDEGEGLRPATLEVGGDSELEPEAFYYQEDKIVYSNSFIDPWNKDNISYSRIQPGEGFGRVFRTRSQIRMQGTSPYIAGVEGEFAIRFATQNLTQHDIVVYRSGGDTIARFDNFGFEEYNVTYTVPAEDLAGQVDLWVQEKAENGLFGLAFATFKYPRQFQFTDSAKATLALPMVPGTRRLVLQDFDHGGTSPIAFLEMSDRTARLEGLISGEDVEFFVPEEWSDAKILVTAHGGVRDLTQGKRVQFEDWRGDSTEYIIVSHPSLMGEQSAVEDYVIYRSSAEGGGFSTKAYNIEAISDQFGYGVPFHPLGLMNFGKMAAENWPRAKSILIIGKAIEYRLARDCNADCRAWFKVPTYGVPGSDNLLFAQEGSNLPFVPVGRIPAINQQEVRIYLEKVKEYDAFGRDEPYTIDSRRWVKNVLHLSGGASEEQQAQLRGYLDDMGKILSESVYGANLSAYGKQNTNATGSSSSDEILDQLQNGVGIVHFFGHSSASTLDFQINEPAEWRNSGRYPIFSALGCSAGKVHSNFRSLAEEFIFEASSGAAAFVGSSGNQYIWPLRNWGVNWYQQIGANLQPTDLGQAVYAALEPMNSTTEFTQVLLAQQQGVTGDPALKFHPPEGPDFVWEQSSAQITPRNLAVTDSSYSFAVNLLNIGLNSIDTIEVRVMQEMPSGQIVHLQDLAVAVAGFETPFEVTLPILPNSAGTNRLLLEIDPDQEVAESPSQAAESNNVLADQFGVPGFEILVSEDRILAVAPAHFSIVTEEEPILTAYSTSLYPNNNQVIFQLDTTEQFNSPELVSQTAALNGNIYEWTPDQELLQETVYYWRVRYQSQDSADPQWDASSFIYSPGNSRGWNQSHYYQFLKDRFTSIALDTQRQFKFTSASKNVWVKNAVRVTSEDVAAEVFVNNQQSGGYTWRWTNIDSALLFAIVVDSISGDIWLNPPGGAFGAISAGTATRPVFPFNTHTASGRKRFIDFIQEYVPENNYVMLYTYQRFDNTDYMPEAWAADDTIYGNDIFSVIEGEAPGSQIRQLATRGSVPYILFFQKGVGLIEEKFAADTTQTINVDFDVPVRHVSGSVTAPLIGPASSWTEIVWNFQSDSSDQSALIVRALSADQTDTLHVAALHDKLYDLTDLDAEAYPYISLEAVLTDSSRRTSPHLEMLRVHFDGQPDYALTSSRGAFLSAESLLQGAPIQVTASISNVGSASNDSVPVHMVITAPGNEVMTYEQLLPGITDGSSVDLDFNVVPVGEVGRYSVLLDVNPGKTTAESDFSNNRLQEDFIVEGDNVSPVLDVIFDGKRITNGDVVSANPEIHISLFDDSRYNAIGSEEFTISLHRPSQPMPAIVDLSSNEIEFTSSLTDTSNIAEIIFTPVLDPGVHTLFVEATDASNNASQEVAYRVDFEVVDDGVILISPPYPNPSRGHVSFEMNYAGSEGPAIATFDVYDLAGRVILSVEEIVAPGWNRFIWNGTTQSGDPVTSGIYTYQITLMQELGESILLRASDPAIRSKNGKLTGKVLILK